MKKTITLKKDRELWIVKFSDNGWGWMPTPFFVTCTVEIVRGEIQRRNPDYVIIEA